MQGNKTVHEILNDLKKYTDRMVMRPDEYTFCRRFISALREPLRQEVLKQGLNPEKSTIGQLYKLANAIQEATRYNQGTRRTEGISVIPSTTQRPIVSKPVRAGDGPRAYRGSIFLARTWLQLMCCATRRLLSSNFGQETERRFGGLDSEFEGQSMSISD